MQIKSIVQCHRNRYSGEEKRCHIKSYVLINWMENDEGN